MTVEHLADLDVTDHYTEALHEVIEAKALRPGRPHRHLLHRHRQPVASHRRPHRADRRRHPALRGREEAAPGRRRQRPDRHQQRQGPARPRRHQPRPHADAPGHHRPPRRPQPRMGPPDRRLTAVRQIRRTPVPVRGRALPAHSLRPRTRRRAAAACFEMRATTLPCTLIPEHGNGGRHARNTSLDRHQEMPDAKFSR